MWCCTGSAGHWICRKEEQLEELGRKRPVSTLTFNSIFNLLLCLQLVTTGINHLAGLIASPGSFISFVLMASLMPSVFSSEGMVLPLFPAGCFGPSKPCGLFSHRFPKAAAQPQVSVIKSQLTSADSAPT